MAFQLQEEARELVAAVRRAAALHNASWEAMVPDHLTINLAAEAAEEQAYLAMSAEKAKLRDHICEVYGISIRELASLAMP
jgi:plasmid stability protein